MALKMGNLALAFLLELCMLAALVAWGFQTGGSPLVRVLLGVGVPLLVILIWARFMAPSSARRLVGTSYLLLKLVIFGAAALGLAVIGQIALAIAFAVVSVVNQVLLLAWKQESLGQVAP